MHANYHTHTIRCHHASGAEREYIEAAIAAGMDTIGFSDHTPQAFPGGYVSGFRMLPAEFPDYISTLRSLQVEYRKKIRILIGLEVEYYPALFGSLLELTSPYHLDYFLLGQHFLGNEQNDFYSGEAFGAESRDRLSRYVSQCCQAIATGRFAYIAHPDLIHYQPDDDFYRAQMHLLCSTAKAADVPLEINFLGISSHRHYPCEKFFRIAAQVGCDVIFGCDAHSPDAIGNAETRQAAEVFADRFGLSVIDALSPAQLSRLSH